MINYKVSKRMRLIKLHWIFYFIFAIVGAPAIADIRAVYERRDSGLETLIFEIADEGKMRVSDVGRGDESYVLFVNEQRYLVSAGPGGPTVLTVEAVGELTRRRKAASITFGETSAENGKAVPIVYAPIGPVNIAGYVGQKYNYPGAYFPDRTLVVISKDDALRPIGDAFLNYGHATNTMAASDDNVLADEKKLLSGHGVLAIWGYELTSINFESIDRSRFIVSATPLTFAEVTQDEPTSDVIAESAADGPQPFVVSAHIHEKILYTLMSDGRLEAWPEGAESGKDIKVPAFVRAFCPIGPSLFLATGQPTDETYGSVGGPIKLWQGVAGAWTVAAEFSESENDPFLTLDCSGTQPLMLSAKMIRFPGGSKSISGGRGGANSATLQHGGFLYVGLNAGEFGGGLVRFPLSGGAGQMIDFSDPNELCGGLLNKDCDPVTGLVPDPSQPDCILASIGLVHFSPSGSIVQICGESASLAYAKPYTLDPNWKFHPDEDVKSRSSVAFYSLAGGRTGTWAVASDGTYHFTKDQEPVFVPFPQSSHFASSDVDWSNSEFVLVVTTMNQRYSISGASLILVPR